MASPRSVCLGTLASVSFAKQIDLLAIPRGGLTEGHRGEFQGFGEVRSNAESGMVVRPRDLVEQKPFPGVGKTVHPSSYVHESVCLEIRPHSGRPCLVGAG